DNPHTPKDILARLAQDTSDEVRKRAVRTASEGARDTPAAEPRAVAACDLIAGRLGIRDDVVRHPSMPVAVLFEFLEHPSSGAGVAMHPWVPRELVEILAESPSVHTRAIVASRSRTPLDIALRLLDDPSEAVRAAVL